MIGCIIQARMGSNRLPGKVLKLVDEENNVLDYVINQLKHCKLLEKIVVATTTLHEDDLIAKFCQKKNIDCFRGESDDVLDRHYQCAKKYSFSTIIRMPSDKPLLDPSFVDRIISVYKNNSYDYVTTFHPLSFPIGTEVEVFSFSTLEKTWNNASSPFDREHVTTFIYNDQNSFKIFNVLNTTDESQYSWSVDTQEDLELVRKIISKISSRPILIKDILTLFNNEKI
tara:strand:- start:13 stop:693 length:681 start_codon:yes stop_codon:yes gene_type:complete